MGFLKNCTLLSIGLASFVSTFAAFGQLTYFISAPIAVEGQALQDLKAVYGNRAVINALFCNAVLAVAFILVHSFLRVEKVKQFWTRLGLGVAHRSIYNLISGGVILVSAKVIGT